MFVNIFQPRRYGFAKAGNLPPFRFAIVLTLISLNANDIIAVCEGEPLMQEIPALIGHFLMENSYTQPLFFSVMTFFLLLG